MRKLKLEELGRISPADFRAQVKYPLVIVLDGIRSGLNVGSIFRTCDAFTIRKILLCGITCQPPHREINKSALGSTETVEWAHYSNVTAAVQELRADGYNIWGIEQTTESSSLQSIKWKGEPVALILGNEVKGLSDEILPLLDRSIEVPQFGTKHSLNVAVCAGIVTWHLISQVI